MRVEVGYYKPTLCEMVTAMSCGLTPFEATGSGSTAPDGSFAVTYAPGVADKVRVRPCLTGAPEECEYLSDAVDLPASGIVTIELYRRD